VQRSHPLQRKNHQGPAGKFFCAQKEAKGIRQVVGAPDIAHPDDGVKWERQTALLTAFVFEMWERVEAPDKKAALEARAELQWFLLKSLGQLLRVAFDDKDSIAGKWACRLLGEIFFSIGKYVGMVRIKKPYGKLMEIETFRDEKRRMGKVRIDVLDAGVVLDIVKHELKTAERYQKRLIFLSSIDNRDNPEAKRQRLKEAATKKGIPADYLPLVDYPAFYSETKEQWWKFLWELIKKNNPDFLQKSRNGGIAPTRGIRINPRWATYRPEFRNAFNTLAKLRSTVGWP